LRFNAGFFGNAHLQREVFLQYLANSAGVDATATTPNSSNFAFISGDAVARLISD